MAIGLTNFQPLTPEQANPLLYGFSQGSSGLNALAQAIGQHIKNQYLPQTLQAKITAQQLQNEIAKPKAQMAPQFAQAQLQQEQQQPRLTAAQAQQASQSAQNLQFQRQNPAFMDVTAAAAMGMLNGQHQGQGQQGGTTQQQLAQITPNMQPGQSQVVGGQQTQNQPQAQNYHFGVDVPTYSDNPMVQNLMMQKFPLPPQKQQQYQQQLDNYNHELSKADTVAKGAFQAQQDLNELVSSYDRLGYLEKGIVGKYNKAWTSDANLVDAGQSALVKDLLPLWQQGHITNSNIDLQSASKISRSQNPDAVHGLAGGIAATNDRAMEYQNFVSKAKDMGIPFQTRDALWNRYQQLRPLYNPKDNLTNAKFKRTSDDFLTPEAIANPHKFVPENQKDLESSNFTQSAIDEYAKKHGLKSSDVREHLRQQGLI